VLRQTVETTGNRRVAGDQQLCATRGADIHRGAPKLGEHEDHVYGELLGMSCGKRQSLEADEIIY
jgi:hypothetical protein